MLCPKDMFNNLSAIKFSERRYDPDGAGWPDIWNRTTTAAWNGLMVWIPNIGPQPGQGLGINITPLENH